MWQIYGWFFWGGATKHTNWQHCALHSQRPVNSILMSLSTSVTVSLIGVKKKHRWFTVAQLAHRRERERKIFTSFFLNAVKKVCQDVSIHCINLLLISQFCMKWCLLLLLWYFLSHLPTYLSAQVSQLSSSRKEPRAPCYLVMPASRARLSPPKKSPSWVGSRLNSIRVKGDWLEFEAKNKSQDQVGGKKSVGTDGKKRQNGKFVTRKEVC